MTDIAELCPDLASGFDWPCTVDSRREDPSLWAQTRTYWACLNPSAIAQAFIHEPMPVAAMDDAHAAAKESFETALYYIRHEAAEMWNIGTRIRHIYVAEPSRDQLHWSDGRMWYPLRVVYAGECPQQRPRPYHVSPLTCEFKWNQEPSRLFADAEYLMRRGDYEDGLNLYEFRWQTAKGLEQWRPWLMPMWDGKKPGRVLVWAEQGAGDVFQFCRYLVNIHEGFSGVFFDFGTSLDMVRLMKSLKFDGDLVPWTTSKQYDYHLPLCSLPLALGSDVTSTYEPYLRADHLASKVWRRARGIGYDFNCGICWGGSQIHPNNAGRSITLEQVLKHVPAGSRIFSLQKGVYRDQLRYLPESVKVEDFTDELIDWADTAAFIDNLDMVVTVDTAIAHLAGAMGKRVKLLLKEPTDWRWPATGSTTTWYKSVQIERITDA